MAASSRHLKEWGKRHSLASLCVAFFLVGVCRHGFEASAFAKPGHRSGRAISTCQEGALQHGPVQNCRKQLRNLEVERRRFLSSALAIGVLEVHGENALALGDEERRANAIFEAASPGVVSIGKAPPPQGSDDQRAAAVAGSGFIWDSSHVVTNYHVIKDMERPFVTFLKKEKAPGQQGKGNSKNEKRITLESEIVGVDLVSDIAVLKVLEPRNVEEFEAAGVRYKQLMVPLPRGSSEGVLVGQDVFALGNPFGLEHSLSRGIVSGVARTMEGGAGRPINGVIQTDASINPGNSGGPLLNSDGKVIGVNTAILTGSGTFAGVGLAIPMSTAEENVGMIISKGFVRRPFLGCIFAPDPMTLELGLKGPMLLRVEPNGPADRAGLRGMRGGRLGDLVVSVGSQSVTSSGDIFKILEKQKPGDKLEITVERASEADPNSDTVEKISLVVELGGTDPIPAALAAV
eukprot:CAMPEP_0178448310 /NCGR_PEP_ID=MMETSP0689_2-20121128/41913_1 /TAXON_ID=160604 /ORGANISM="Amphidinium massartii, Strain CS-259" /LENGTH=460 /DNA_ID=CAMNT_0020073481 /DNA_START=74 /DNA_END=1452 /DNA_ORIENTATION=+